jgi:hypothetical protein
MNVLNEQQIQTSLNLLLMVRSLYPCKPDGTDGSLPYLSVYCVHISMHARFSPFVVRTHQNIEISVERHST